MIYFWWAKACVRIIFKSQTQDLGSGKHCSILPPWLSWNDLFFFSSFYCAGIYLKITEPPSPLKKKTVRPLVESESTSVTRGKRQAALITRNLYKPVTTGAS